MKRIFKVTVSLLLAGVLSLTSVFSISAAPLPLYGDVDGNGKINVIDVTDILKYLADISQFTPDQAALADYNGDGKVDVLDVTDIQKMLVDFSYKYAHGLYEVENVDFSSEGLTPLEFKVDKCIRPYFGVSNDYLYNGSCHTHLRTLFKTYDEYSRFFKATFDEYNEKFFEENALIFMYDKYYTGSISDSLDNAYVKENVLYLECTHREPAEGEPVTEDLGYWNQFISVNKASVENIDKICVKTKLNYYYWK